MYINYNTFYHPSMDFYTLLYETISNGDECNIDTDTSLCLITNEPLEEHHITLYCGHSFNYEPLYREVIQQKKKKQSNEIRYLRLHEIKCPYCRNVQRGILPQNPLFETIYGVNSPEDLVMMSNNCNYIFRSGPRKGQACNKRCLKIYCNACDTTIKKREKKKQEKEKAKEKAKKEGVFCKAILKSGKRKGLCCGNIVKNGTDFRCGRHSTV